MLRTIALRHVYTFVFRKSTRSLLPGSRLRRAPERWGCERPVRIYSLSLYLLLYVDAEAIASDYILLCG